MIRLKVSGEFLTDMFTRHRSPSALTEGGLDSHHNTLISVEHDTLRDHVIMLFEDGKDEITDRTITFAPI